MKRMRQFYLVFQKGAKPSHLLSWSHYVEFLKISDDLERGFDMRNELEKKAIVKECLTVQTEVPYKVLNHDFKGLED